MKTIYIIDRDEVDRSTAEALLSIRYGVKCYATVDEAAADGERNADVIVLGYGPDSGGDEGGALEAVLRLAPAAGFVIAGGTAPTTVRERPPGACRRIQKPYRPESLLPAVRAAAARAYSSPRGDTGEPGRQALQPGNAGQALSPKERRLIGDCAALRNVAERIALFAADDAPVLILGESGTGKELAAAALHRASRRCRGRFLPVDCATLSESLAESTLFGTVKGAYTDATEKRGAFESARGGTVFLDEIGELSLPVQAKFLRTLETGTGTRVGSVDPIAYDVRVVSATNAAIFGDCRRFRPELLHRINTLVLEMPPLRSHKSDIPALSASFLAEFNPDKRMAEEALDRLIAWDWPGNVRELRNVVKRAVVLSGRRELITAADIELDGLRKGSQGYLFA